MLVASAKRKSAVELLQESKAFYVKSEKVLDRKQELKNSTHLQVSPSAALDAGIFLRGPTRKSSAASWSPKASCSEANTRQIYHHNLLLVSPSGRYGGATLPLTPQSAPLLPPKSPCLSHRAQRRTGSHHSTSSDELQLKLRRLLNVDSKENVFFSETEHRLKHWNDCKDDAKLTPGNERLNHSRQESANGSEWRVHHKSLPDLHTSSHSDTSSSTSSSENDIACEVFSSSGSKYWQNSAKQTAVEVSSSGSSGDHHSRLDSVWSRTHSAYQSAPVARCREVFESRPTHRQEDLSYMKHRIVNRRESYGSHGYRSPGGRILWQPTQARPNLDVCEAPPAVHHVYRSNFEGACGYSRGENGNNSIHQKYRMGDYDYERRRPILRSKSDISHKYSRGVPQAQERRPPVSIAELNKFFEQLGLDNNEFQSISAHQSDSSSPVFFSSISSVDSGVAWGNYATVTSESATHSTIAHMMEQPSIIERNARIIKWLCQCRKARFAALRPR